MINAFSVLLIASVALAQQIPTGVSTECSNSYKALNEDTSLASCTASLNTATSGFAPGGSSPSSSAISSALSSICSESTKCTESTVRTAIAKFRTGCNSELTSGNTDVIKLYDFLYSLVPLRAVICSKDDNAEWCIPSIGKNIDDSTKTDVQKYLVVEDKSAANATTYGSSNLVFAFLRPSMNSEALCTSCTRSILTSYITFQSNTPYAPGLENSLLFTGETELYKAVTDKCGPDFLGGAVQAAGGISSGLGSDSNAAVSSVSDMKGVVVAFLGAAALALL